MLPVEDGLSRQHLSCWGTSAIDATVPGANLLRDSLNPDFKAHEDTTSDEVIVSKCECQNATKVLPIEQTQKKTVALRSKHMYSCTHAGRFGFKVDRRVSHWGRCLCFFCANEYLHPTLSGEFVATLEYWLLTNNPARHGSASTRIWSHSPHLTWQRNRSHTPMY